MKNFVLFHANCMDGLMAAAIHMYHTVVNDNTNTYKYIACNYTDPVLDVENSEIIFLDFCYKRDEMLRLLSRGNKILLIDHHISQLNGVKDLIEDGVIESTVSFENTNSGAGLTWNHFFPSRRMPVCVRYVEDRDLWNFNFTATKAYTMYLSTIPKTKEAYFFELKDSIEDEDHFLMKCHHGTHLLKQHDSIVDHIISSNLRVINFGPYKNVPVINTPYQYSSDVASKVLENPEYEKGFAVCFNYYADVLGFSLRSRKDLNLVDVSTIAKEISIKGGGHFSAAGANIPYSECKDNEFVKSIQW